MVEDLAERLGYAGAVSAPHFLTSRTAATGISHESIYRFIYAQIRRTNDGSWRH